MLSGRSGRARYDCKSSNCPEGETTIVAPLDELSEVFLLGVVIQSSESSVARIVYRGFGLIGSLTSSDSCSGSSNPATSCLYAIGSGVLQEIRLHSRPSLVSVCVVISEPDVETIRILFLANSAACSCCARSSRSKSSDMWCIRRGGAGRLMIVLDRSRET